MAFRFDEAEADGYEWAMTRFITNLSPEFREKSRQKLADLITRFGPVVDAYPCWHPLVASNYDPQIPHSLPNSRCGYDGLDHTIYLRNAFISCPYGGSETILKSVDELECRDHLWVTIEAEELDFKLYQDSATPVLVWCDWHRGFEPDGTIPSRFAIARILEQEVNYWERAELGETWQTMRPFFLGKPCGARSSLFVNQETGQKMKNVWNALLAAGVFGPIKV